MATAAYIELDGITIPGKFLHGSGTTWRSGIRTGVESERPFVFAKVPDEGASPFALFMLVHLENEVSCLNRRVVLCYADPSAAQPNYRFEVQKCGRIALSIRKISMRGDCDANAIVESIPEPMKGKGRMFPLAIGCVVITFLILASQAAYPRCLHH